MCGDASEGEEETERNGKELEKRRECREMEIELNHRDEP